MDLDHTGSVSPESVHSLFRGARRASKDRAAIAAGVGSTRKGEFALALAERIAAVRAACETVVVPPPFIRIFEFLYPHPAASMLPADGSAEAGPEPEVVP